MLFASSTKSRPVGRPGRLMGGGGEAVQAFRAERDRLRPFGAGLGPAGATSDPLEPHMREARGAETKHARGGG
jgi:hypothetical protein